MCLPCVASHPVPRCASPLPEGVADAADEILGLAGESEGRCSLSLFGLWILPLRPLRQIILLKSFFPEVIFNLPGVFKCFPTNPLHDAQHSSSLQESLYHATCRRDAGKCLI